MLSNLGLPPAALRRHKPSTARPIVRTLDYGIEQSSHFPEYKQNKPYARLSAISKPMGKKTRELSLHSMGSRSQNSLDLATERFSARDPSESTFE